jgi:hypothetical protein
MPGPVALSKSGRSVLDALTRPWMRIWFQNRPTTPIEITRIGPGLALRLNYAMVTPYIFIMWGDEGWLPRTLHGFPQCRAMWARVAPLLPDQFTLVCADLRGCGGSAKPICAPDRSNYAFRALRPRTPSEPRAVRV